MIAAYLQDPAFEAAIARVTSQPHRTWVSEHEIRPIDRHSSQGRCFVAQFVRPACGCRGGAIRQTRRYLLS